MRPAMLPEWLTGARQSPRYWCEAVIASTNLATQDSSATSP